MSDVTEGYKQTEVGVIPQGLEAKNILQKPTGLKEYQTFLQDIKNKILESRINAAKSVNQAFIGMYWFIGQMIVEKQQQLGWEKSVVEMLSNDLKKSFPEMTGFSPQNLWLTRQFYLEYSTSPILQQLVGEIPWGNNVLIMQKVKGEAERRYYLESTAKLACKNSGNEIMDHFAKVSKTITMPKLPLNKLLIIKSPLNSLEFEGIKNEEWKHYYIRGALIYTSI